MGLLDKMKAIKNAVTGGAAKVFVEAAAPRLNEPFTVTVRATPQGCDVKYDRVYLDIEGVESVEVPDFDVEYEADGQRHTRREIVRRSATTLDLNITIDEAGELKDGEDAEWTAEISLPEGAVPAFQGHFTRHEYRIRAGLDCFGNDPDSGWEELRLG